MVAAARERPMFAVAPVEAVADPRARETWGVLANAGGVNGCDMNARRSPRGSRNR